MKSVTTTLASVAFAAIIGCTMPTGHAAAAATRRLAATTKRVVQQNPALPFIVYTGGVLALGKASIWALKGMPQITLPHGTCVRKETCELSDGSLVAVCFEGHETTERADACEACQAWKEARNQNRRLRYIGL